MVSDNLHRLRRRSRRATGIFTEFGRHVTFYAETVAAIPFTIRRYSKHIAHHIGEVSFGYASLLAGGGTIGIVFAMSAVAAMMVGVETYRGLDLIGLTSLSGLLSAIVNTRELAPVIASIALAAKVGTGFTAQLGAMRISEEIDAVEVMGIDSMTFLVATRVVAGWIAMPFLYILGLSLMFLAEKLVVVDQLASVSPGGYSFIFWLYQSPGDLLFSLIKIMAMGTVIIFVGCYFGYTAKGEPVGVGRATARSMIINMVLIHIIGLLGTQLFWGLSPNAPIAN